MSNTPGAVGSGSSTPRPAGSLSTSAQSGGPVSPTTVGLGSRNPELLVIRVQSLENELNDTKRLLLDAICDRKDLEKQKDELVGLITELSGGKIDGEAAEEMISDRAKRTMMMLRMERTEGVKQRLQTVVRQKSLELKAKIKFVRDRMQDFKGEVEEQLNRLETVITSGSNAFEHLKEKVLKDEKQRMLAQQFVSQSTLGVAGGGDPSMMMAGSMLGGGPGGTTAGGSGYLDMVTAAVKEQQKSIVLPPDHPIIIQMKKLFDMQDELAEKLNTSWETMRCFREGKPPQLHKLRRFVDPLVNINNYSARIKQMSSFVEHADLMSILFGEMHLPQLERTTRRIITSIDRKLKQKLQLAYEAMNVIRSPAAFGDRSVSNCIRLFAAADGVQPKLVQEIQEKYNALCKEHTGKCFRYIRGMLKATISYSKSEGRNMRMTDEQLFDYMPDPNAVPSAGSTTLNVPPHGFGGASSNQQSSSTLLLLGGESTLVPLLASAASGASGSSRPRCANCEIPLICEDCVSVETKLNDLKDFLEFRRKNILNFTEDRVMHLNKLMFIIDDILLNLRKARIISVDAYQLATRTGAHRDLPQPVVGSSSTNVSGGNSGGASASQMNPNNRSMSPSKSARSGAASVRSRSPAGGPKKGMRNAPQGAEQAALKAMHKAAITSSTFYFAQLRKRRQEMAEAANPIALRTQFIPKAPPSMGLGSGSMMSGRGGISSSQRQISTAPTGTGRPALVVNKKNEKGSGELEMSAPDPELTPRGIPHPGPPPTDPKSQAKFLSDLEFLEKVQKQTTKDRKVFDEFTGEVLPETTMFATPQARKDRSKPLGSLVASGGLSSLQKPATAPTGSLFSSGPGDLGGGNRSPRGPPALDKNGLAAGLGRNSRAKPRTEIHPTQQQTKLGPLMDPKLIESLGRAMEFDAKGYVTKDQLLHQEQGSIQGEGSEVSVRTTRK